MYHGYWGQTPLRYFPGAFPFLGMVIVAVLIAILVVFIVRKKNVGKINAIDIVKTRYANGEISKEEMKDMITALKS